MNEALLALRGALAETGAGFIAAAIALAVPALAFALIAFIADMKGALAKARAASGEVRTNLTLYAFDLLCIAPALAFLAAGFAGFVQENGASFAHDAWTAAPTWAVLIVTIFVGDAVSYWRHRLEHTKWLWPAHAIHHSDERMTWTTLLRFHPLNRLTSVLIDSAALALLGFPPWAIAANNLVRHYYGMFIHMDLPWTYGPLGRVFVSPAMHRWHHVRDGEGVGSNFATVFSVFDQAFATHYVPGPCAAPLGVREDLGQGALGQLAHPFRVLGAWLGVRARRPLPEAAAASKTAA
ncbi:MAG: sterol desaturase family protein [Hyphomonadaceae bacterium]